MNNYVIVLTGPTGVGKTDLSLEIASKYNGEIINCDASQFKKELNIGTAKLDYQNIPIIHHLFDIIEPIDNLSIASYQKLSRELIKQIWEKGKTPILVGGSGLYICACIYNYNLASSKRSNDNLYDELNNQELFELLTRVDYNASKTIHPNNRKRVLRAIELSNNCLVSENKCELIPIYKTVAICLNRNREDLYNRINLRVEKMIEDGFIEEVKYLVDKYQNDFSKITDIGYQEIYKYLNEEISYQEMLEKIKQKTRNYAKRQLTWFRNKMKVEFINIENKEQVFDYLNSQIDME